MTNAVERAESRAVEVPSSSRIGQGTAIEQSRAAAEVHAAIVVAQQVPRDMIAALSEMEESCRQIKLAERAFYRYNRGGGSVSGPSVHLARELARCFRNVQYGIAELRRDDEHGQSEMQAYAWDVQNNTRSAQIFIVPHKRDKKGGPEKLVDLRDVYENNANQGARRLRQAIWSILPPWFVEQAIDLCTQTLQDGGGVPLPQRVSKAIDAFEGKGVSVTRLEERLARRKADWTAHDVAQLTVIYQSLNRGEVTVDEEFPTEPVTAAEIAGKGASKPAAAKPAAAADPQPETGPVAP